MWIPWARLGRALSCVSPGQGSTLCAAGPDSLRLWTPVWGTFYVNKCPRVCLLSLPSPSPSPVLGQHTEIPSLCLQTCQAGDNRAGTHRLRLPVPASRHTLFT